ncbi:MAG: hypothetical protein JF564_00815 [Sphingomonas sp.]|nr:hypothetical protein [Sphingomonas sp.]
MGLSSSWMGFQNVSKDQLLEQLGLTETGEEGYFEEVAKPYAYAELPGGWLILFVDDFDWADPQRVVELSEHGLVIGCQFNDKSMMGSVVSAAEKGGALWQVSHRPDYEPHSAYHLDVKGDPPPALTALRDRHVRDQDEEGGEDAGVDHIFEVPLELAKQVCGFRYDESEHRFKGAQPKQGGWASSLPTADSFRSSPGQARSRLSDRMQMWGWLALFLILLALAVTE